MTKKQTSPNSANPLQDPSYPLQDLCPTALLFKTWNEKTAYELKESEATAVYFHDKWEKAVEDYEKVKDQIRELEQELVNVRYELKEAEAGAIFFNDNEVRVRKELEEIKNQIAAEQSLIWEDRDDLIKRANKQIFDQQDEISELRALVKRYI